MSKLNLHEGENNFTLTASNQCGNDIKEFKVIYTPIKTIDPPKPVRWFDTIEGIHKKGEELGISTDGCLTIGQYEEKIRKAGA